MTTIDYRAETITFREKVPADQRGVRLPFVSDGHGISVHAMIDGKRKLLEMSDEEIEEVWSNPDWTVGDVVSQRQRQYIFEIIATGPQCVLMRNVKTGVLNVDSNSCLGKHYQRERQVGKVVW